jgi:hypothetical protein
MASPSPAAPTTRRRPAPKPRLVTKRHQPHPCFECRRTNSPCDEVRPVCGSCRKEKGLGRCWVRAPRRRKRDNLKAPESRAPEPGESQPTATASADHSGRIDSPPVEPERASPAAQEQINLDSQPETQHRRRRPPHKPRVPSVSPSHRGYLDTPPCRSHRDLPVVQIDKSTAIHLVHLFFEKVQPWLPMLHFPIFMARCGQCLCPSGDNALQGLPMHERLLFLGIFAISARFSSLRPSKAAVERGEEFAVAAKKTYDMARNITKPSLTYLQGCILLAFYYYTSGLCAQGWVIVGVCVRLSYALLLHEMDGEDPPDELDSCHHLEIEGRRRAWWLVWELDCFGSTVLQRPFAIDQRRWTVRLPMSDEAWFSGRVEFPDLITWAPGQIWRALVGMGTHDERACFLVANVMLSLVVDRAQQKRGISLEEKMTIENDVNCVVLALPPIFDLSSRPPLFDPTSFGRNNWVIGTHLLLAATTCIAAEIKVAGVYSQDPTTLSTMPAVSTNLTHMHKVANIVRHWSPDYISLAHPFLAFALVPILAMEPPLTRSSAPYPSFHDLATLVQRKFAEKWKVGEIAISKSCRLAG